MLSNEVVSFKLTVLKAFCFPFWLVDIAAKYSPVCEYRT